MVQVERARNKLRNVFRGLTPTLYTFDTNPTDVANITDGDFATVSGTGSKVLGSAGTYGSISFDVGDVKTVLMGGKLGLWSSTGNVIAFVGTSLNGSDWVSTFYNPQVMPMATTGEQVVSMNMTLRQGRYFRVFFYAQQACTAYVKIYSITGHETGI